MSSAKTNPGTQKRKLWSDESMTAAVECVQDGKAGLREASRLYNVPVETLRRRVVGVVQVGCRPGPATVLTEEEEDRLSDYLMQMAEMGFGLTREDISRVAYSIAERSRRQHPFKDGKAGRGWFEGFMGRHPKLTIRTPQPLSYCRALCSNKDTIEDFFGKLGALYGRLNLISKPMQIFNADETGVSVVHKPGKVIAELGRHNVYSLTSAERGKTHTVLSCVSAAGFVLPPLMVYPRKKSVPDHVRQGAIPNTMFANSENGWSNKDIYLEWFRFFLHIPPARPVLLIQDGHASHMSIELIELARANGIHLLCLPAHTTHILQPLDVGVFKSFKSHFFKSCHMYLTKHPGRVITTDVLASIVAEAWPHSFTPLNILGGFKKCGVYPINPGAVSDRQLAPSKAICPPKVPTSNPDVPMPASPPFAPGSPPFTSEQEALYERRFEEGYDLPDPSYMVWLKITHPEAAVSAPCSETASSVSATRTASISGDFHESVASTKSVASVVESCSSDVLSDILVLPEPQKPKRKQKRKPALNSKTVCITDDEVLEGLKTQEVEKQEAEAAKQLERKQKKQEREEKKAMQKQAKEARKKEKERKRLEREKTEKDKRISKKPKANQVPDLVKKQPMRTRKQIRVEKMFEDLTVSDTESSSEDGAATVCPKCGAVYGDEDKLFWICCDGCDCWFDLKCTSVPSKHHVSDLYFCESCL